MGATKFGADPYGTGQDAADAAPSVPVVPALPTIAHGDFMPLRPGAAELAAMEQVSLAAASAGVVLPADKSTTSAAITSNAATTSTVSTATGIKTTQIALGADIVASRYGITGAGQTIGISRAEGREGFDFCCRRGHERLGARRHAADEIGDIVAIVAEAAIEAGLSLRQGERVCPGRLQSSCCPGRPSPSTRSQPRWTESPNTAVE